MKTSRLALGANPCGATHPCASASTCPAKTGRTLSHLAAILCLALIGQTAIAASVNLAWNPNPESDIAGYKVSYGTSPGSYSNTLATGTATTSSVSGLSEGQNYYFVVKAVNTAGLESAPSAEVSYQVPLPPNTAPVASAKSVITNEDQPVAITLSASDQDGDPLTFSIVGGPTKGSLSGIAPNLTYMPNASASGSDSFSFRASDGKANSNTATISIAFTAVNDQLFISPVADQNVIKGGSVGPIAFTVSDVKTSAISLSVLATSSNTTVLPASGITLGGFGSDRSITLTPAEGQSGAATVTLQVSDGELTASTSFTLTVQEVVADPTLHLGLPFEEFSGDKALDVSSGARHGTLAGGVLRTDDGRHGRALDFAAAGAMVQLGALDIPGSAMTLAAWIRADSFAIDDARILSKASGVNEQDHHWMLSTISSSGIKPRLRLKTANGGTDTLIGTTTLTTGVWTHLAATYDGTTMRLFVNGQPAGTLAKTGAISQSASVAAAIGDQPQGTRAFDGLIDEVRLYTRALPQAELLQIMDEPLVLPEPDNTAPTISTIDDQVIPEDGTAGPIKITVGDAESSASDLVISVASSDPALLTEAGMVLGGSGAERTLSLTPAPNQSGASLVTVTVSDGFLSATSKFTLTISPANQAPVAATQLIDATAGTPVGIVLSASDANGDPLTFSIVGGPTKGSLSGNPPNLTYTPNASASGSDSISFRASDGMANSNTATVSITVAPVNDTPLAAAQLVSTLEDTALGILLSANDKNGDALTYRVVSSPAMGTLSGSAPNLTYTPKADANGSDSFTFVANDGKTDSNIATVSINVIPVNDAPVSIAQTTSTPEDKALGIFLSANDKDGDNLSYRLVSAPSKGSLGGTAPNLTYIPHPNANGQDSFRFLANDGTTDSNTTTVSITITPVNDAPVAVAQLAAATAGIPVGIVLSASDLDGDPLTFSIVGGPVQGSLSGNPPNLTYTANANASGSDSFTFRANDGKASSNTATISISITAAEKTENKAPVFQSDLITRADGLTGETYSAESLSGSAVDPDGDAVSYSKAAGPEWLSISPDGEISGTPPASAEGLNSFTIRSTDPDGAFDEAVLEITILSTELPLPWSLARIGSVTEGSTAWGDSGSLKVKSSGSLFNSTDDGLFLWQTLGRDGSIIARIDSHENTGGDTRIGLEIRESLAPNSRHVFIGTDGSGSLRFVRRTKTGGNTSTSNAGSGTAPDLWLQLVRSGGSILAYSSSDGSNWTRIGKVNITLEGSAYIGLVVCGGENNISTGIFREVDVQTDALTSVSAPLAIADTSTSLSEDTSTSLSEIQGSTYKVRTGKLVKRP